MPTAEELKLVELFSAYIEHSPLFSEQYRSDTKASLARMYLINALEQDPAAPQSSAGLDTASSGLSTSSPFALDSASDLLSSQGLPLDETLLQYSNGSDTLLSRATSLPPQQGQETRSLDMLNNSQGVLTANQASSAGALGLPAASLTASKPMFFVSGTWEAALGRVSTAVGPGIFLLKSASAPLPSCLQVHLEGQFRVPDGFCLPQALPTANANAASASTSSPSASAPAGSPTGNPSSSSPTTSSPSPSLAQQPLPTSGNANGNGGVNGGNGNNNGTNNGSLLPHSSSASSSSFSSSSFASSSSASVLMSSLPALSMSPSLDLDLSSAMCQAAVPPGSSSLDTTLAMLRSMDVMLPTVVFDTPAACRFAAGFFTVNIVLFTQVVSAEGLLVSFGKKRYRQSNVNRQWVAIHLMERLTLNSLVPVVREFRALMPTTATLSPQLPHQISKQPAVPAAGYVTPSVTLPMQPHHQANHLLGSGGRVPTTHNIGTTTAAAAAVSLGMAGMSGLANMNLAGVGMSAATMAGGGLGLGSGVPLNFGLSPAGSFLHSLPLNGAGAGNRGGTLMYSADGRLAMTHPAMALLMQ